ncbi:hypothetical protein L218DRAFT_948297 [Marasmius fiardii PR-910]|nr:hypothetical protein L218DRAFT_948297 [Marasmius fiardii PR-910]
MWYYISLRNISNHFQILFSKKTMVFNVFGGAKVAHLLQFPESPTWSETFKKLIISTTSVQDVILDIPFRKSQMNKLLHWLSNGISLDPNFQEELTHPDFPVEFSGQVIVEYMGTQVNQCGELNPDVAEPGLKQLRGVEKLNVVKKVIREAIDAILVSMSKKFERNWIQNSNHYQETSGKFPSTVRKYKLKWMHGDVQYKSFDAAFGNSSERLAGNVSFPVIVILVKSVACNISFDQALAMGLHTYFVVAKAKAIIMDLRLRVVALVPVLELGSSSTCSMDRHTGCRREWFRLRTCGIRERLLHPDFPLEFISEDILRYAGELKDSDYPQLNPDCRRNYIDAVPILDYRRPTKITITGKETLPARRSKEFQNAALKIPGVN